MRRPTLLLVPLIASVLVLGCGDGGGSASELVFPDQTVNVPDLTDAGSIVGVARFEGQAPKRRRLAMSDDHCGGGMLLSEDAVITGDRLANVVIFLSRGLEAYTFPHEKSPAHLDQKGCQFLPHVLAVRTHQPVAITNGDTAPHNVNTTQSRQGQGFNVSMTQQGQSRTRQFHKVELSIPVTCELHSWMKAFVHVFDHPYFTVTKEDGTFSLPQVPPGSYRVSALHERFGRRDFELTVPPKGTATIPEFAFTFQDR